MSYVRGKPQRGRKDKNYPTFVTGLKALLPHIRDLLSDVFFPDGTKYCKPHQPLIQISAIITYISLGKLSYFTGMLHSQKYNLCFSLRKHLNNAAALASSRVALCPHPSSLPGLQAAPAQPGCYQGAQLGPLIGTPCQETRPCRMKWYLSRYICKRQPARQANTSQ